MYCFRCLLIFWTRNVNVRWYIIASVKLECGVIKSIVPEKMVIGKLKISTYSYIYDLGTLAISLNGNNTRTANSFLFIIFSEYHTLTVAARYKHQPRGTIQLGEEPILHLLVL